MYSFSYWHAYYDTLFLKLKENMKPSEAFLKEIQVFPISKQTWNAPTFLPQISKIFSQLQQYLAKEDNWRPCSCSQSEINAIEDQLNNLSIVMLCEKRHARQYWQNDRRRLQSSVLHYFILLKCLVICLIPNGATSVGQTIKQDKLCKTENNQTLINSFLQKIQPIWHFMLSQDFQQQKNITYELFNDITYFCKNLPNLSKEKLKKIPKLMKYICLKNTLDAKNYNLLQISGSNRKKSQTSMFQPVRKKTKRKDSLSSNAESDICDTRDFIKQKINFKNENFQQHSKGKGSKAFVFKFSKDLSRRNTYLSNKKNTLTSTDKGKGLSIDTIIAQRNRSTTFASPDALNLSANKIYKNRKSSNKKDADRKDSYMTESDISRTRIEDRYCYEQKQEEQTERNSRVLKRQSKNPIKKIIFNSSLYSQSFISDSGKPKGWGLIRQYLFKRIAKRKIKRCLLL